MVHKIGIRNYPKQEAIFKSKAKYVLVSKGRRAGLTRGMANNFIKQALLKQFESALWVDVTNRNLDLYVQRYFLPALRRLPRGSWSYKKLDKILYIGDSYIDLRSADYPEAIEGFGYDTVFLNEAGILLKDDYLWGNAIKPMLYDSPNVKVIVGGTPKGRTGRFFELCQRGKDSAYPNYEHFHLSPFDNPYINRKELRSEVGDWPELARRQEIEGEFLDDSGVVFR